MGNAIWLFFALPTWYFSTVLGPFAGGPLTAIPAFGALCLVIGVVVAYLTRQSSVWVMVVSPIASQGLVVVAGFLRGQLPDGQTNVVTYPFIAAQVVLIGFLVYRMKSARIAASLLAVFCITYALFATVVATMSFNDAWM
jgi:hypothetical protein